MKRNAIMQECRQLITPEIKRSVDLSVYVANRIFDILEKQDKSQRDLAKALGKSEAEISKWLQGTHNFTFNTVAKIEIALGEKIIDDAPRVKSKMCSISFNKDYRIPINVNTQSAFEISDKWSNVKYDSLVHSINLNYGN